MKAESKREIIKKYASTEDDVLMLAKVFDKQAACREKSYIQTTRFLSLHECITADTALRGEKVENWFLYGGYDKAERKIAVFYPDYLDMENAKEQAGLCVIRAYFRKNSVTHRDMLGSLMNIGITRECIGDLLVHDEFCDIICIEESTAFILNNLFRAGHESLRLEITASPAEPQEDSCKIIKDTVASLRLDAIVSSGCSVSRGTAGALIASGKVKLNDTECLKGDRIVNEGDLISVRGCGRIMLDTVAGLSRKGRIIIEIKKYL